MKTNGEVQASQKPSSPYSFSISLTTSSSSSSSSSTSLIISPTKQYLERQNHYGLEKREAKFEGLMRFTELGWKDVANRFDRLSSAINGPEPVVKWSDFGFCLGMQQSPEFAKELLRALRGRRDPKFDITKTQLHTYWHRLSHPSFDSRLHIFFHMCDKNMDGKINEGDLKQAILLSASTNKLSLTNEEAKEYAALIFQVLDTEDRGYIEAPQLAALFRATMSRQSHSPLHQHRHNDRSQEDQPMRKAAEILLRTHWRRAWIILLWLIACVSLFAWKFIQYKHRTAFEVMGYCLCTAKGAAETLKLNMAVILLPVCRNTITWLRRNQRINSLVPFNDNINFHKLIAGGIVIGVILHGGTHLACDFPRISGSDQSTFRQTIAPKFGYHQPSYVQILTTTEVATGIAMVVLMSVTFVLATKWPRRGSNVLPRSFRHVTGYNTFWYSHHLLILVYALLIVHSMFLFLTNNLTEKTTWMYIAIPVMIYAGERIFRAVRSGFYEAKIMKASIFPGKIVTLKLQKPQGFKYKSGMYIFMQCPQISPFQWHPFSLTSGPEDDYISVHIRTLGDWSYQMYSLFQEAILSGVKEFPKIWIDGPYGAASQDHVKYDVVMLIGLGIGATPFISILRDVANGLQKPCSEHGDCGESCTKRVPLKAYFYWVTREQSSFDWFRDILVKISTTNQKQSVIEVHNFLTSIYQEGDARSALISTIQALQLAKDGTDIVSWTQVRTHFSRPNWFSIFSKLAATHSGERVGVFYCGPSAVAGELERLCIKFSTKTMTRFVFHKENY